MTIYIEEFLIQNFIINFCLLRLTCITLKPKSNLFCLSLSALIGAGFSIFCAVFLSSTIIMNLLKILCSLCMILIAFKQNRKGIIASFITLFLYTYALGGFITTLSSTTYQTSFGVVMSCKINLYLICMIIIAITYIFELVAKHIKFKLKTNNLIYKLTLKQNNEHLTINAFMDTGNLLNIEGKPVIILDLNCFLKLNKSNLLNFYLSKSEEIKTQTVTGNNNLKIFQIDELNVNYENKKIKIEKPYIAVNTTDSFKNCNYQALLSPAIL